MKTISKTEKVKRWLMSGKSITSMQAINHFQYTRLADGIYKLKKRGLWIINIGSHEFAKYILVENGLIKNMILLGYRLTVKSAFYVNGYSDMTIRIIATNGNKELSFYVYSSAFRDKKIMIEAIKKAKK